MLYRMTIKRDGKFWKHVDYNGNSNRARRYAAALSIPKSEGRTSINSETGVKTYSRHDIEIREVIMHEHDRFSGDYRIVARYFGGLPAEQR